MEKCRQIANCFRSDHFESWERGLALLQEPPQGLELYERIGNAVLRQAKLSGVPSSKLSNSPLVEELEHLVLDLFSISRQSSANARPETVNVADSTELDRGIEPESVDSSRDGDQMNIPSFVRFMRGFLPGKDTDIWTYILEKRIKPSLVQRCELKQIRHTSYIDPDKEPPERTIDVSSDLSVHDRHKEMLIKDSLARLVPLDQAIFLMTYWSFLTMEERAEYRPAIIAAAVANCTKRKHKWFDSGTAEELIRSRHAAFEAAESNFHTTELSKKVEAAELQVRISYHFVAAEDAEQCKVDKAQGFLHQYGNSNAHVDPKPLSNITEGLAPTAPIRSPQDHLREICHLAASCSSQDKFNTEFYLAHPLDSIYHYKQKQGVLKIRDQGLWLLMWFGRFCQRQSYHLSAYQSIYEEFDSMKQVIGFSDDQIGTILCENANNIRQRRHRYRKLIKHFCPPEAKRPSEKRPPPTSLPEIICADYQGL